MFRKRAVPWSLLSADISDDDADALMLMLVELWVTI